VGDGFREGRVGQPSSTEAFRWYERAAVLGDRLGINNLGCCYQFGNGVQADPQRAFELYSRAVELNEPMALINLAICYERGIGTSVDAAKGAELRRRAASAKPAGPAIWLKGSAFDINVGAK
jgi:TPR repeat protein